MASDEVTTTAEKPRRRRFFDTPHDPIRDEDLPAGSVRASAATFNAPRGMTAATEVIDLRKAKNVDAHRTSSPWQESAWNYTDQIGELKFAFNLVAQIVSRAMLYPAIVTRHSEVPVASDVYLDQLGEMPEDTKNKTKMALETAEDAVGELIESGQAEILRMLALNMSIPGECYLLRDKTWTVVSISEFTPGATPYLNRSKKSETRRQLPADTYVARLWRAHPRWYAEPDSSMLGVLDQCEKVVLFDQVIRALSRSRLGAGIIVIPNGLTPIIDGLSLPEALAKLTVEPVESEAAGASVTPLILQGPAELADKIKHVDLGRQLDEYMLQAYDGAIDRMLAGLDIPKNVVTGLADVKFSNALVIDDALYKAHIEPLLLLICDCLTNAYLHPILLKSGVDPALVKRLVIWYNPSQIVTRPDRSQAASEGYEKMLLSGKAWRAARGFSELDAPDEDEIIKRLGLNAQVPPEMATVLIEALNPDFFAEKRKTARDEAGVPPEVQSILNGETPPEVGDDVVPNEGRPAPNDERSGGQVNPNGTLPPGQEQVQANVQEMLR